MKKRGFTLLEMIIVMGIIAFIISIATPYFAKSIKKSKAMADVISAKNIAVAIQEAILDGKSIEETNSWSKVQNISFLNNYIENFSSLKPKMNSLYDFYYKYEQNKLYIGAGDENSVITLYPEADIENYK
ncbi:prepilin-type N-terminal cleavage/methylation domain-containing protein [Caloramator fervidus]|uniref:Prepilin-type N-terminal cleavage/methylation domain-containing protein n=1 Tax=Caloramator fervidus TaxID=29344 RepID=A0A1H5RM42_9CLOT|nr:type II secretion system protein [Caloramator fervidus]SEF38597.1 prepilin-type N-terminal cleavage/methylation domain-containing protein [Caloramator fervidus]